MWTGRFEKFTQRPANSVIGTAYADWVVADEVVYTYSQAVDGVADKADFKAKAIAGRDEFLARQTKNVSLGEALTTYLNN